jgi:ankyrin repeat protein
MIVKYAKAIINKTKDFHEDYAIYIECNHLCRYPIVAKCIELYPECLTNGGMKSYLLLHFILENQRSNIDLALLLIEKNPRSVSEEDLDESLAIHVELKNRCRSIILCKCVELNPWSLKALGQYRSMSLHLLLENPLSTVEDAMMMIEKFPEALEHRHSYGFLPLHLECMVQCRSPIISKCIELYPAALSIADQCGYLPLHRLLRSDSSSVEDVLVAIEKYPAALQILTDDGHLPLHLECAGKGRSSIISKCIELYPEALSISDNNRNLPLTWLFINASSTIEDALMLIEKYPAALRHQNIHGNLPLHYECGKQFRSSIVSKCIECHPESLDD